MSHLVLDHIRLYCSNLTEIKTFYETTLSLPLLFGSEKQGFYMFNSGLGKLIVEKRDSSSELVGRESGLTFSTQDFDASYNRLSQLGVKFLDIPREESWGGRSIQFKDPAGNKLTLAGR